MKKFKIVGIVVVLLLVLSSVVASFTTKDVAKAVTKITISDTNLTLMAGETQSLKINGTAKKVNWETHNNTVATVSAKGLVAAVKSGFTTITATVNGKKYTCKVTVVNIAELIGQAGVKGDKGDKGETGATGAIGAIGATGGVGPAGATGPAGADGVINYASFVNYHDAVPTLNIVNVYFPYDSYKSSNFVERINDAQFNIVNPGTYLVHFQVPVNGVGTLFLLLGTTALYDTKVTQDITGMAMLEGTSLVKTTEPNQMLVEFTGTSGVTVGSSKMGTTSSLTITQIK